MRVILCLSLPKFPIFARAFDEIGVAAFLNNFPVVKHSDLIAEFAGRESMANVAWFCLRRSCRNFDRLPSLPEGPEPRWVRPTLFRHPCTGLVPERSSELPLQIPGCHFRQTLGKEVFLSPGEGCLADDQSQPFPGRIPPLGGCCTFTAKGHVLAKRESQCS